MTEQVQTKWHEAIDAKGRHWARGRYVLTAYCVGKWRYMPVCANKPRTLTRPERMRVLEVLHTNTRLYHMFDNAVASADYSIIEQPV